jgi:hypothetical protein
MPQFVAWASPTLKHCILQHDNLGGGLLIIVDLFVVVDDSVSCIDKLAGADERIVGKGEDNVCTLGRLPYIMEEFVDSGCRCCGPIREMEDYYGPSTSGD